MAKNNPSGWRMRERDEISIEAVYTHRAITTFQIYDLVFSNGNPGPPRKAISRCRHRLRMLHQSGFLARLEQPTIRAENRPYLYQIDKLSIPILAARLGLEPGEIRWTQKHNQLKAQSINHLLAENDFRIAMEIATVGLDIFVTDWIDDLTLRSSRDLLPKLTIAGSDINFKQVRKIPDGYFSLQLGDQFYDHFLEIDMGTEPGKAIKSKAGWYVSYFDSHWHQEIFDNDPEGLLVLVVSVGRRRLENLKRIFEEVGADGRFWFTTLSEATALGILDKPIWSVAGEVERRNFFDE